MSGFVIVTTKEKAQGKCLFWKPLRAGYTSSLTNAGKYSREEAEEICGGGHGNDIFVSHETAFGLSVRVVDFHDLAALAAPDKWEGL